MRTLIGPPAYNGPVYTGQENYVGRVINGRIYNGVCHLHYLCIRGLSDEAFASNVATCWRMIEHLRRCTPPAVPA